ncbi:MerR family transcriptional regulator [Pedococcus sp. 5OH_020]|uniref:MerR family transcriptional regulator n=1 Tax=Pedococcus sp. 5OH_020 TaxID=2989814 RepID=UPI0022E9D9AF|nr:MerR family transcriptional regulator [Pedococcus sp. 5OH_020]
MDSDARDAALEGDASERRAVGPPAQELRAQGLLSGVGAVSQRVGIARDTLRTWDRRYGVGPSHRTQGGHRRYTEEDIRRVGVMAGFAARGVPAQAAARVALAMDSDRLADDPGPGAAVPAWSFADDPSAVVHALCAAAVALDAVALAGLYQTALRERGVVSAWTEVFAPALTLIGDQWGVGVLGVESEHLASEVLVTELRALVQANRPRSTGVDVVLATPDEEQHYLPLLALEAQLARHGVGTTLLGPRVPTTALHGVLSRGRPSRLFLWASLVRPSAEPLWEVLQTVDWPMTLVLGGPGWPAVVPAVRPTVRVRRPEALAESVSMLLEGPSQG